MRRVCPEEPKKAVIELDYGRMQRLIGKNIGNDTIEKILTFMNYEFISKSENGSLVAAPSYMIDVTRECDVVEEVLRVYGYNNIELPTSMRMSVSPTPSPDPEAVRNYISNFLAANGFVETMNNSLTKSDYYKTLATGEFLELIQIQRQIPPHRFKNDFLHCGYPVLQAFGFEAFGIDTEVNGNLR